MSDEQKTAEELEHEEHLRQVADAKTRIREISVPDARDAAAVWVDVRDVEQFDAESIPGAVSIPLEELEQRLGDVVDDKSAQVVAYCNTGKRSALATDLLQNLGYTNVVSLEGGIEAYKQEQPQNP